MLFNRLNKSQHYKKRYLKVVLMVIDAMRYDFAQSSNMSYVNEKIANDKACLLKLKVEAPTVTLPRIKSLTTGTIPNFIDVVLNFGSSKLQSDSLIYQIHRRGDRIVFCGDNTWLRLFPGKFYKKYVNNDSFFVQDFYTGDAKITEQVMKELDHHNWDFLILHYLGLDHIGHVEGPFSSKISLKLAEMNEVITKIHSNSDDEDSLVLVTADHGMRDTGGHGGHSIPEIMVPFLSFSGSCKTKREIIYNQIDVTPTLSVLFGVPIPTTSIGCIIAEFINFLPLEDQLYAFYYNNVRLLKKIQKNMKHSSIKNPDYLIYHNNGIKFHQGFLRSINDKSGIKHFEEAKANYISSTKLLSEILSSELCHFDMFSIFLGITLAAMVTSLFIWWTFFLSTIPKLTLKLSGFVFISLIAGCVLQIFFCKLLSLNSQICKINILGASLFALIVFILGIWRISPPDKLQIYYQKPPYLFAGIIVYALSLQGTSFIEEEHQTWYDIVTTILLYLCINELRVKDNMLLEKFTGINELKKYTSENILPFHNNLEGASTSLNKTKKLFNTEDSCPLLKFGVRWIFVMGMHIFLRRLNRSGNKWINLPDIGDWLNLNENQVELNVFCFLALVLSFVTFLSSIGRWTKALTFIALILVYYLRAIKGLFLFYKSNDIKIPLILFLLCITAISLINYIGVLCNLFTKQISHLKSVKNLLGINIIVFGLISMLLHKPHNIVLVPVCIITLKVTFSACDTTLKMEKELLAHKVILAIWIGKMFFFYQGNSNNLASIDLNPGFIGLDKYNFYISGVLITLNTFFGPLCSIVVLLYEAFDEHDAEKNKEIIPRIFLLICMMTALPTSIYLCLMVIFRSHLFIWSVFAPKLLYEAYSSVLQYLFLLIFYIYYKLLRVI